MGLGAQEELNSKDEIVKCVDAIHRLYCNLNVIISYLKWFTSICLYCHFRVDPDQGPWKLTLDLPCFEPFMKHSRRRDLREIVYRAYVTRASTESHNNSGIIEDIRKLRYGGEIRGYLVLPGKYEQIWCVIIFSFVSLAR